jgi:hypothetical protein
MKLRILFAALALLGVCSLATTQPAQTKPPIISADDTLPIPCVPTTAPCN